MRDYLALQRLAQLLFPNDRSLVEEVMQSEFRPYDYIARYGGELRQRGISEPAGNLPWIALVNGLARRNLLIELDWKEYPDGFVMAANELLARGDAGETARQALNSFNAANQKGDQPILNQINSLLEEFDITLVVIDIDSDCYPLSVIPLKDYEVAENLAQETGYGKIYRIM